MANLGGFFMGCFIRRNEMTLWYNSTKCSVQLVGWFGQ